MMATAGKNPGADDGRKTVLIVDDEIDMRLFMSTLVETSGYHCVMARNGRDGLKSARAHLPDAIVLDIMMPQEGGVHMYGELKTDNRLKHIPVIILSAISRKTFFHYLKMLSIRMGDAIPEPEAYMEKPPEAEEIRKKLASLVKK